MDVAAAFAGIANAFSHAFGGAYHDGVARWTGAPVFDDGGSIVTPGTPEEVACRVQVDSVTEAMRQSEGYRDQDMRLLVLSAGLERDINTDCTVTVLDGPHAGAWRVASVSRDPCGIYHEALGRRA
jgi:hypothetical protein